MMTDIILFTGRFVCDGFSKLKYDLRICPIFLHPTWSGSREYQHRFPFLCMFPNKTQIICQVYIERGGSKSLDFKFYSAIHRQCLKRGRLLNLLLLKMKNGCSFFYKKME